MAHTPFQTDVLSPEGEVFSGEVQQISTKTVEGSLGILAGHSPLLGRLEPSELRLYKGDDDIVRYVQGGGYVQITAEGSVLMLVDEAYPVEEYDGEKAKEKAREADEKLKAEEEGTESHRLAKRAKKRADALAALADRL